MELKFDKSTDTKHKVNLEPKLIYAEWVPQSAPVGQKVSFQIGTSLVGQGAPVEVKGKSAKGKKLGTVKGKMRGNKFSGEFTIPDSTKIGDMVYFDVKLPKNNLTGESNRIAAVPPIIVTNLQWSAREARRGDILTLSAKVENVPDAAEVKVTIYEFDQDGSHDKIVEIPAIVKNKKVELQWEYEYHEDTDEIPTQEQMNRYGRNYNPPEYFFTVKVDDQEFGKAKQDSGLLEFKDWIEIELKDSSGNCVPNEDYILHLPDGQQRSGKLDEYGRATERDIPPGKVEVEFPNLEKVTILDSGE